MRWRVGIGWLAALSILLAGAAKAQRPAFSVASIHPSAAEVKFERDGETKVSPGKLEMRDVTVGTCIRWAYQVQHAQVAGPDWIEAEHFDVMAKTDEPASEDQMRLMLQTLLAERFKLAFHRQNKELSAFVLTEAKGGNKLRVSPPDGTFFRENSANGMVSRSMTMGELATYIAGPLEKPVVDRTGLKGRYDFDLDFKPYLPEDGWAGKPDVGALLNTTMQAELGLKLEAKKATVEVMVADHVERPSEN